MLGSLTFTFTFTLESDEFEKSGGRHKGGHCSRLGGGHAVFHGLYEFVQTEPLCVTCPHDI